MKAVTSQGLRSQLTEARHCNRLRCRLSEREIATKLTNFAVRVKTRMLSSWIREDRGPWPVETEQQQLDDCTQAGDAAQQQLLDEMGSALTHARKILRSAGL